VGQYFEYNLPGAGHDKFVPAYGADWSNHTSDRGQHILLRQFARGRG